MKARDYYGFICHKSQDKQFAFKLQKRIENYRIPRKLGYPTLHMRHVFVDQNELRGPELKDEIIDSINKSDTLIVLCSRASASPVDGCDFWGVADDCLVDDWKTDISRTGWVGFEISTFMDKNPEKPYEHIIPVVIDGDPEKGDCFHPLLLKEIREHHLRYFDFRKKEPYLDVIEAVLNPDNPDEFRKRDKQRRLMNRICSLLFIFIALLAAIFAWDNYLPHAQDYNDYVLVNEVPVGIQKYTGYGDHYRITTRKADRFVKLEHLNGLNIAIPEEGLNHPDGPMIANYKLRDTGYPDTVEYLDRNGIVQMTYTYATDLAYVTFQENSFVSDQVYPVTEENEYGVPNRMNIDRYDLQRDDAGRTVSVRFKHGENYVIDDEGVAGYQYDYDKTGRLKEIAYISRTGEVNINKSGISRVKLDYDSNSSVSSISYYGSDGTAAYCENGYAVKKIDTGVTERISTYLDTDGNPMLCKQWYAKAVENFDKNGNRTSVEYFGLEDEPMYCSGKYHAIKWTYDGQERTTAYYGLNDSLVQCRDGFAKEKYIYDDRGNLLERSTYGSDDQPVLLSNHAATERYKYADGGYLKEKESFGIHGQPVINDEGYHKETREYDDKNRLKEIRYYGIDGEAVYCQKSDHSYHSVQFEYDSKGNMRSVSLLNTENKLISSAYGHWAKKEMTYSGGGQVETLKYTDTFGNLINASGNFATLVNSYDDRGLLISTSYFDEYGKLSTDARLIHGVLTGKRFYAKISFDYDEYGNASETKYYSEDGKLTRNYIYAIQRTDYDKLGRVVHSAFYDADENPASDYSTDYYVEYDAQSHVVKVQSMTGDDPRAMFTDENFFAYGEEQAFDRYGNMVERTYLSKDGEILQQKKISYNKNHFPVREEYYGRDGSLILCSNGYAIKSTEYDERNNEIRQSFFGTDEEAIGLAQGYSQIEQSFNEDNVMVRKAYLDEAGELTNCISGYAVIEDTVNNWRSTTRAAFYDRQERELFSYNVDFNENYQKVAEWLAGPDGEYLNDPSTGIALIKYFYSDTSRLKIREEYYDENGEPADFCGVTSGWESKYATGGLETERTNLNADFLPAPDNHGIITAVFEYDDLGREVQRIFLDADRNDHNCDYGFSRYKIFYNDKNEIIETMFWDQNGKEVTDLSGEVKIVTLVLHNGDYEIHDTEVGTLAFTPTTFNVKRVAYEQDGNYDLMLQYQIPFDLEGNVHNIIKSANKRYAKAGKGDPIILLREDGPEIIKLIDSVLISVDNCDAEELMATFNQNVMFLAAKMIAPYAKKPVTADDLLKFYYDFYEDVMLKERESLIAEYGDNPEISYVITDIEEMNQQVIQAYNGQLAQIGLEDVLEDMMNLEILYTVNGNGKTGELTKGFFYPKVTLLKFNDVWTLGTSEGFPSPGRDELLKLLEIE